MSQFKVWNYFFKVVKCPLSSQLPKMQLFSPVNCNSITTATRLCLSEVIPSENSEKNRSVLDPANNDDLTDYASKLLPKFNFAMYADKSPLVQKLIDLGVNLYEIEKHPREAQYLVTLNFKKIKPYLLFLKDNGISADNIGKIITKNPFLFKEDLDDLEVRVNYLKSKKFDTEMICNIITKCPKWLSVSVRVIDERLGFLQQNFKLKGDEVRQMITRVPKLALLNKRDLVTNIFALKEEMGLDEYSLKKLVVLEPTLLKMNPFDLVLSYEYLTNIMKVPLDLILKHPKALTCRKFILKERHRFLESLGRAQYCNYMPGYVNLLDFVETNDEEFCEKVAKTSVKLFYDFLKTF